VVAFLEGEGARRLKEEGEAEKLRGRGGGVPDGKVCDLGLGVGWSSRNTEDETV
jgi:hypothetical protein